MMSGKQKRAAIMARRHANKAKRAATAKMPTMWRPSCSVAVNAAALAPYNSYGEPEFVPRGFYADLAFTCRDCGAHQVWTAAQQQWWYETAKGYVYSTAVRCLNCRRLRRAAHRQTAQ